MRHRLGKMAATLYALESVTYMTAGLADAAGGPHADPARVETEACMTKSFALRAARRVVDGRTKGPSINDVTQIFGVFGLPPPFVTHSRNLSVLFVTLWVTPPPP